MEKCSTGYLTLIIFSVSGEVLLNGAKKLWMLSSHLRFTDQDVNGRISSPAQVGITPLIVVPKDGPSFKTTVGGKLHDIIE